MNEPGDKKLPPELIVAVSISAVAALVVTVFFGLADNRAYTIRSAFSSAPVYDISPARQAVSSASEESAGGPDDEISYSGSSGGAAAGGRARSPGRTARGGGEDPKAPAFDAPAPEAGGLKFSGKVDRSFAAGLGDWVSSMFKLLGSDDEEEKAGAKDGASSENEKPALRTSASGFGGSSGGSSSFAPADSYGGGAGPGRASGGYARDHSREPSRGPSLPGGGSMQGQPARGGSLEGFRSGRHKPGSENGEEEKARSGLGSKFGKESSLSAKDIKTGVGGKGVPEVRGSVADGGSPGGSSGISGVPGVPDPPSPGGSGSDRDGGSSYDYSYVPGNYAGGGERRTPRSASSTGTGTGTGTQTGGRVRNVSDFNFAPRTDTGASRDPMTGKALEDSAVLPEGEPRDFSRLPENRKLQLSSQFQQYVDQYVSAYGQTEGYTESSVPCAQDPSFCRANDVLDSYTLLANEDGVQMKLAYVYSSGTWDVRVLEFPRRR